MLRTTIMVLIPWEVMPRRKKKDSFLCPSPAWPAYLENVTYVKSHVSQLCSLPEAPWLELFPPAQMDIPPSGRAWNVTMECPGPTFSWLVAWSSVESTQPSACAYFAIFECPQSLHQPSTESSQPMLCQQLCLPGSPIRPSCSTSMKEGPLH